MTVLIPALIETATNIQQVFVLWQAWDKQEEAASHHHLLRYLWLFLFLQEELEAP